MAVSEAAPGAPLVSLLAAAGDPARTVAFGGGGPRTLADFHRDVAALARRLDGDAERRWLVWTEDSYRVAVAIFAAAAVRARVALPPNLQPGTLGELAAESERVLVDDGQAGATAAVPIERMDPLAPHDPLGPRDPLAPPTSGGGEPAGPQTFWLDRDAPLVELFTSGTSGPGKRVTKALRHLEDEVATLEGMLGDAIGPDASVVATVSPHHLYGLLFRVLWPLGSGRPLARTSFLLPDELLASVAGLPRVVVVSSPAHLRHLAASSRLAGQAARIAEVFSSGGPLETATALSLEATLGNAPVEIFGSTETGGVARRRVSDTEPSPYWKTFPPVAVGNADGCLEVTSPFVTPPAGTKEEGSATWRMGDRVEMHADGFALLGRGDRVAKVGEKTLSLPEMETQLLAHGFVQAAAVGPYAERRVQRVGAIVVLTRDGARHLAEEGRRSMQALLAAHLAPRWDPVALPRRWRFRDALPFDARGKLSRDVFERDLASPNVDPALPFAISESIEPAGAVCELVVPRDLAYFSGHYDGFPLVPGAVQVLWVTTVLGRMLGRDATTSRMEAIKFRNVMKPGQRFTMTVDLDAAKSRASFTLAHDGRVFSSGRLALAT
jgi:acyl-coenzyme A synthetase/AMP-(fatty) acid ligase/3-hydroxymyristoyl/3-hydroxydecanoyl-(acyl carrier protein) dehydratase